MSIEYKIIKTKHGDTVECDSCGCEAPLCGFGWGVPLNEQHDTDERYLCEVCASTYIGNITRYPRQDNHRDVQLAKIIAQVANHLIEKMKK